MSTKITQTQDILRDLEDIYIAALKKGNFTAALKAKELLGRISGLFSPQDPEINKEKIYLKDLSDDDISCLIEDLEDKLKLDPDSYEE